MSLAFGVAVAATRASLRRGLATAASPASGKAAAVSKAAAPPLGAGALPQLTLRMNPATMLYEPAGPIPDKPLPLPGDKPFFRKRTRMHDHWKLRPVRRWSDFAPYVNKIVVAYDPMVEGSAGARELGRQVCGERIRRKFPKYVPEVKELENGSQATVTIEWSNGKSSSAPAHWITFEEILDKFDNERTALEWEEEDKEMN